MRPGSAPERFPKWFTLSILSGAAGVLRLHFVPLTRSVRPPRSRRMRLNGVNQIGIPSGGWESDSYFGSRPFQSQITAVVSRQSQPLTDQNEFSIQLANLEQSSSGKRISRPENWGGFKVMPEVFEFWIHGEHRRHERTLYKKDGDVWNAIRLYP